MFFCCSNTSKECVILCQIDSLLYAEKVLKISCELNKLTISCCDPYGIVVGEYRHLPLMLVAYGVRSSRMLSQSYTHTFSRFVLARTLHGELSLQVNRRQIVRKMTLKLVFWLLPVTLNQPITELCVLHLVLNQLDAFLHGWPNYQLVLIVVTIISNSLQTFAQSSKNKSSRKEP